MSEELITLPARCHCGQARASAQIPASAFPLSMYLCHCNSCNKVSGHLAATVVTLPPGSSEIKVEGKLASYKTSNSIERFFCGACGTSVYEDASGMGMMLFDTGALEVGEVTIGGKTVPVAEPGVHIFTGDTKDGGARDWLPQVAAWEAWPEASAEVPQGEMYKVGARGPPGDIKGKCHCGGIEIEIKAPAAGQKYEAFVCPCNDCRLASGFDITEWATVPKSVVTQKGPELKTYNTSKEVTRYFCGKCGANMSADVGAKPDTMDVALGLLHRGEGHRMQDSLKWRPEVSRPQYAQNKAFMKVFEDGYKNWAKQAA